MRRTILLLSALYSCILPLIAQNWSQMNKVVSNERAVNDQFGFSVGLSGDYAIIGCHREDEDQNGANYLEEAGAAYIYRREDCSWVLHQKIVASDRKEGQQFGLQVTIAGDYAFVGTYFEDRDENGNNPLPIAGAVYVFKNNNGNWMQVQKIVAPVRAQQDFFGYSFEVSGDLLVIGAYTEDEDQNESNFILSSGSAYVYKNIGGVWSFQQKLVANDRGYLNYFGFTVDIQNNTIMVGAYNDPKDENGMNEVFSAGSVYFFNYNGSQWVQTQKVVSYERTSSNWFGYRVKLSGEYAFIGVQREAEDENGGNTMSFAGAVYVLYYNGSNWVHNQKLVAPDRAIQDFFGNNLAASGDHLLVSAYREDEDSIGLNTLADAGSSYLFINTGGNWQYSQKICPADRGLGDFFSLRLDIDGDYILLSASLDDEDISGQNTISNSGSAYFFRNTAGNPCDAFDACQAIDALIQAISSSNIPGGIKNSLISKLQSAKSSFQNGQYNAAINKLNAFINEVQAQSGKKIPVELANDWIAEAMEIIEAIESEEAVCGEENGELKSIKIISSKDQESAQNILQVQSHLISNQHVIALDIIEKSSLYITDMMGHIVHHSEFSPGTYNIALKEFQSVSLPIGYYTIFLVSANQMVSRKFLITK